MKDTTKISLLAATITSVAIGTMIMILAILAVGKTEISSAACSDYTMKISDFSMKVSTGGGFVVAHCNERQIN